MIPKINKSGRSFADLALYLTHDPKAQTTERVAWTHTHNLANDSIPAAVNEMLWTYRDAEILKQEAGVRAGGRPAEHPVKHISLNWAPDDNPSEKHMKETGLHFLKTMGWDQHQAIFVAHSDKHYKHLHIMINEIHPETGLKLDDNFEYRRVQRWAAEYEFANGVTRCLQRFLPHHERDKAMPRNIWMEFRNSEMEFEKSERHLRKGAAVEPGIHNEWQTLKAMQRDEREQFFADGKVKFKELRASIYREVRGEFRERWADFYKEKKLDGAKDPARFADMKAQISDDQKMALTSRRDTACAELLTARKFEYVAIKDEQKLEREEFRDLLATGRDNAAFFQGVRERRAKTQGLGTTFREAGDESTASAAVPSEPTTSTRATPETADAGAQQPKDRDAADVGRRRVTAFAGSFLDALFTDLTTLGSAPRTNERDPVERDLFEIAAEEATKQSQHEQRQQDDEKWRQRSKESYGE